MDNYPEQEDILPKGHVKLKEGIDIQALLDGQGDTFEINFENMEDNDNEEDEERKADDEAEETMMKLSGICLGLDPDEEDDEDNSELDRSSPFEKLAQTMKNVTEDGKIKKKIKKDGKGSTPPANSLVNIKYSSYLEHNDSPTDSAFMSKPFQFRLGNAGIFGLNIAVQSMKVNEIAWFLIHPDYAYGPMGHLPRIPPNATFLFYIELLSFVDSGPALELERMSAEDKRKFSNAQKSARGLLESGKHRFNHNARLAIRDYNRAMTLLEECTLSNIDEQEEQQKMLCKIYANLAVCYTKENEPKKACIMCNNIYAMTKNTSLNIPAKVYFHNGRALKMLKDYKGAKEKLLKAQKLQPNNDEIHNELKVVVKKLIEDAKREREFSRAFIQNKESQKPACSKNPEEEVDSCEEFQREMKKQCQTLKENSNSFDFKLPWGLSKRECEIAKTEAELAGLVFREDVVNANELGHGQTIYMISKS